MSRTIKDRLSEVLSRIEQAAVRCERKPNEIHLVAVGKTKPADLVREAGAAGALIIGENYIQEARDKFNTLIDMPLRWHFIGHLQSNKAKYAVRMFDLIHTVDTMKLAVEIDKRARSAGKVQDILVQVNISGEVTKSGTAEEETLALVRKISGLKNVKIKGLMTMPPFFDAPDRARPYFIALRRLRDHIASKDIDNIEMQELSMGMTGDFEVAIEEGATLVRVGTAIFGERS